MLEELPDRSQRHQRLYTFVCAESLRLTGELQRSQAQVLQEVEESVKTKLSLAMSEVRGFWGKWC